MDDPRSVIDFDVIRASAIRMGVDPMGGFGVHDWPAIAQGYADLNDRFYIAFACDTGHDRHGIVARGKGRSRRIIVAGQCWRVPTMSAIATPRVSSASIT